MQAPLLLPAAPLLLPGYAQRAQSPDVPRSRTLKPSGQAAGAGNRDKLEGFDFATLNRSLRGGFFDVGLFSMFNESFLVLSFLLR
jgi:hypothetical protein